MNKTTYPLLPETVTFHTALLEDSVYSSDVLGIVQRYFLEKVSINIEFRLCERDEIPKDLKRPLNVAVCERTLDEQVNARLSNAGISSSEGAPILKKAYEDAYEHKGFSDVDAQRGTIYLVTSSYEKIEFEIAKHSGLTRSTVVELDGMLFRAADYLIMPPTEYDYNQTFASRLVNAISDIAGVKPCSEAPKDLAEDHEGNPIADTASVDPSIVKYHFFLRESQKMQIRAYFSGRTT